MGNTPEYNRAYYEKNKARIKRMKRKRYLKNSEAIIARQIVYNRQRRERLKAEARERYEALQASMRSVPETGPERTRDHSSEPRENSFERGEHDPVM